jgi:peptidoglycan LD-endopeptidase LytH
MMPAERLKLLLPLSLASLLLAACGGVSSVAVLLPYPDGGDAAPYLVAESSTGAVEDEMTGMLAVFNHDLARARERESLTRRPGRPERSASLQRPRPAVLPIPVAGLSGRQLQANFDAPRDGGKRRHTGLDIFAPRGTEVLSVSEGYVSYIGEQPKGGRCLWVVSDDGRSFYYAHLDRWAPGLYEGMEVRPGDVLGYVGTTGNAVGTPPHLHFAVVEDERHVDPFPLLRTSGAGRARPPLEGGVLAAQ